jgi:hypothetical protein
MRYLLLVILTTIIVACSVDTRQDREVRSEKFKEYVSTWPESASANKYLDPVDSAEYFYSSGEKVSIKNFENIVVLDFNDAVDSLRALRLIEPLMSEANPHWKSLYNESIGELLPIIGHEELDSLRERGIVFMPNVITNTAQQGKFVSAYNDLLKSMEIKTKLENLESAFLVEGDDELILATGVITARYKPETSLDSIAKWAGLLNFKFVKDTLSPRNKILIYPQKRSDLFLVSRKLYETQLFEYVVPDTKVVVNERTEITDPLLSNQWYLENRINAGNDISIRYAWDSEVFGQPTVSIAFIDCGIDYRHEDLKDNYLPESGRNYLADANSPEYLNPLPLSVKENHGTRVAGLAVAKTNNAIGMSGICSKCSFIPIRALPSASTSQELSTTDINALAKAFDYATTSHAAIISNSYGFKIRPGMDDLLDAIRHTVRFGRGGLGTIVVFAAPNTNTDFCALRDIASSEGVVSVSGINNLNELSRYGYGSCLKLLAPSDRGTQRILTTDITSSEVSNYTYTFGGTSASAAIVAGAFGLMLSIKPDLSRAEAYKIMFQSADKVDASRAKYDANGHSKTHGYGRINIRKLIDNVMKYHQHP